MPGEAASHTRREVGVAGRVGYDMRKLVVRMGHGARRERRRHVHVAAAGRVVSGHPATVLHVYLVRLVPLAGDVGREGCRGPSDRRRLDGQRRSVARHAERARNVVSL